MKISSLDRKKPVNGGSRPWVKCEPRVPWQEYEHMKRANVPDMHQDEPDSYTVKKDYWKWQEV